MNNQCNKVTLSIRRRLSLSIDQNTVENAKAFIFHFNLAATVGAGKFITAITKKIKKAEFLLVYRKK